jgi:hypothetical protein
LGIGKVRSSDDEADAAEGRKGVVDEEEGEETKGDLEWKRGGLRYAGSSAPDEAADAPWPSQSHGLLYAGFPCEDERRTVEPDEDLSAGESAVDEEDSGISEISLNGSPSASAAPAGFLMEEGAVSASMSSTSRLRG